jgi:hypothetical protein
LPALVTSPRLPWLLKSPRRTLELVEAGALVWIAGDHKRTAAHCQFDCGFNINPHEPAGRRLPGTAPAPSALSRRKAGADVPVGDRNRRRRLATEQVASMKHASTRAVFDYWNGKRGPRPAPERADIDPADIRHALSDTFMLAADFVDQLRFRLAGTRVCALFGREIKGEAFADLWSESSRAAIDELLAIVIDETAGVVAGLTGRTEDGAETDLELLLLPLAHSGPARVRALGVLAPTIPPYWIGAKPVIELTLGTQRHIGADADSRYAPRLMPMPDGSRLRHGFVVYSGGRATPSGGRTS